MAKSSVVSDYSSYDEKFFGNPDAPYIIESMEAKRLDMMVARFVEMVDEKKIDFDVPVQRGYVWNNRKDSLLICSIIRMIPISNFYYNKAKGIYEKLEGKQRGRAIYRYIKGEYKLHATTPSIRIDGKVYPIAGRTFEQLDKKIQNRILGYSLDIHYFEDMTIEQKIEFFILTNSGKPVTAAEISRIRVLSRKNFMKLVDHPAIVTSFNETAKLKRRHEDYMSQMWCMCFSGEDSMLQKDISDILATVEATDDELKRMTEILDYMVELFKLVSSDKKKISKMHKPTHMLSLAYAANYAINKGISVDDYSDKMSQLFSGEGRTVTVNATYNTAVGSGSSKPEQMKIRKQELEIALMS